MDVPSGQRIIRGMEVEGEHLRESIATLEDRLTQERRYTDGVEAQLLESQHDLEQAEDELDRLRDRLTEEKHKARLWKRRAIRYKGERSQLSADLVDVKKDLEVSTRLFPALKI